MEDHMEAAEIQWHPGFYGAAELELDSNRDDLEFQREYNLSKKPLRLDLLIIKKLSDIKIKNEIGYLFKKYNIIEYKSPDDGLSIDDYYKTVAYVCLYKGLGKTVNQIPAEELTMSIFRDRYPRELFKELKKIGLTIEERFPGIYYVKGHVLLDAQVIVISRLDKKAHRSLRLLSPSVQEEDIRAFIKEAARFTEPGQRNNAEAVLQVSSLANQELYDRIRRESFMNEAMRWLVREDIEEAERKGERKGVQKGEQMLLQAIKNLMSNMQWTADQTMSAMSIPPEAWSSYKAKLQDNH
ncbi:MAG: hypothetical protein HFG76_01695 [Hungatella sp.]|nr:hypothetical protein [Hungatella sp.]